MKGLLILLFGPLFHSGLIAQTTSVTVKAGSKIKDVLATEDLFLYPRFIKGKVFFRDGTKAEAQLNYCSLGSEMHFIGPKGDTLVLAGEETVQLIQIDKDSFYYDKGYVRIIGGNNYLKLARKELWIVTDTKKVGAYNTSSNSSSITSYTAYNEGGRTYDLVINEDMLLKKAEQYYFGDKFNHFVLAGKQNLLALFPKKQGLIKTYLKENKIDFDNREDLGKLVRLLSEPAR
ncbi:MAG TPA: hypothetical protein VM935_17950 [Chitinophagaceae bacterium]|nr:hypothetical protein [Chitinophagaceae bacterium]